MKKEIDTALTGEWLGEFWCIENEELKYPGILNYTPNGDIKLTLLWNFEKTQYFFNNNKKYFNFIGNVAELGNVSLMGCIRRGSYCDFGKYNKVEFLIQYFINGAHLDNSKQHIKGFHFSFPGFNKFCSPIEGMQLYNKDKIMEHKWNGLTFTIKNLHNVAYELKNLLLPYRNRKLVDKILKDIDDSSLMISEYTPFLIINFDKPKNFTETKLITDTEKNSIFNLRLGGKRIARYSLDLLTTEQKLNFLADFYTSVANNEFDDDILDFLAKEVDNAAVRKKAANERRRLKKKAQKEQKAKEEAAKKAEESQNTATARTIAAAAPLLQEVGITNPNVILQN